MFCILYINMCECVECVYACVYGMVIRRFKNKINYSSCRNRWKWISTQFYCCCSECAMSTVRVCVCVCRCVSVWFDMCVLLFVCLCLVRLANWFFCYKIIEISCLFWFRFYFIFIFFVVSRNRVSWENRWIGYWARKRRQNAIKLFEKHLFDDLKIKPDKIDSVVSFEQWWLFLAVNWMHCNRHLASIFYETDNMCSLQKLNWNIIL